MHQTLRKELSSALPKLWQLADLAGDVIWGLVWWERWSLSLCDLSDLLLGFLLWRRFCRLALLSSSTLGILLGLWYRRWLWFLGGMGSFVLVVTNPLGFLLVASSPLLGLFLLEGLAPGLPRPLAVLHAIEQFLVVLGLA